MSNSPQSTDRRLCRHEGCGKPAAEGWRLCVEHVEARTKPMACDHGEDGKKPCLECLAVALHEEATEHPYTLAERDLLAITSLLDTHPMWWDHPCMCADCRSYGDG